MGEIVKSRQYDLWVAACVILAAVIGYQWGRVSGLEKTPIRALISDLDPVKEQGTGETAPTLYNASGSAPSYPEAAQPKTLDMRVVGSKNGSKYHHSWCSGVKTIKPENQVWFASAQEAEAAGYTLAGNCSK